MSSYLHRDDIIMLVITTVIYRIEIYNTVIIFFM